MWGKLLGPCVWVCQSHCIWLLRVGDCLTVDIVQCVLAFCMSIWTGFYCVLVWWWCPRMILTLLAMCLLQWTYIDDKRLSPSQVRFSGVLFMCVFMKFLERMFFNTLPNRMRNRHQLLFVFSYIYCTFANFFILVVKVTKYAVMARLNILFFATLPTCNFISTVWRFYWCWFHYAYFWLESTSCFTSTSIQKRKMVPDRSCFWIF